MTILSKLHKLDNFESCYSLKLCFTNISSVHSNFVGCESFLESNSLDVIALSKTNLEDLIDFSSFSMWRGMVDIFFCLKALCHSYAWFYHLCEGETFLIASGLSLENSEDSY